MHSTTTTARQDDTTRRGIDLIFIISLTFRRGKLGLVCASLMLPITSSLLKYRSESETGPHPDMNYPNQTATTRIKALRARNMRHGREQPVEGPFLHLHNDHAQKM